MAEAIELLPEDDTTDLGGVLDIRPLRLLRSAGSWEDVLGAHRICLRNIGRAIARPDATLVSFRQVEQDMKAARC